jgi:hypothetical protein
MKKNHMALHGLRAHGVYAAASEIRESMSEMELSKAMRQMFDLVGEAKVKLNTPKTLSDFMFDVRDDGVYVGACYDQVSEPTCFMQLAFDGEWCLKPVGIAAEVSKKQIPLI